MILIVDDQMSTAQSLKDIFEKNNFQAHIVTSAEDAVKATQDSKFEVIVSDVNLINMDGFELSRTIRKTDKDTPIILYTSMMAPEDFDTIAKRIGVTKFISNANIKTTLNEVMIKLDKLFERNEKAASKVLGA